ncbi:MAG: nucleotidyltransferase [Dehalococcoidia bacterium]
MVDESTLASWTGPSSDTEQEKQDRTERMIRQAVDDHPAFDDCRLQVFAKGSYANNTNVRTDSDVDVAVECQDVVYWKEAEQGLHDPGTPYTGPWTPEMLRQELTAALEAKFPEQVDTTGSVAIAVNASTARVEADVVPCFSYVYYLKGGGTRTGTKIFPTDRRGFENFPDQQLANGRTKNRATGRAFKKTVRILKRVANRMTSEDYHREVPSYFVECLVYNCPNHVLERPTWTSTVKGVLAHIWDDLEGEEPDAQGDRWLEVNECFFLFHDAQKWSREDARDFAYAALNYLGFGS